MTEPSNSIPDSGTFAVLTIDPVASVDYLEDPEATAASAELASRHYVICDVALKSIFNTLAAFREERVYFVQQGPPQAIPAQLVDASMSIPIAPQTCSVDDHPSKREPVKMATNPFPFPDCYLSAFASAKVRTANVEVAESAICEMEEEERFRVLELIEDDFELHLDRLQEQQEAVDKRDEHEITLEHMEQEEQSEVELDEPIDEADETVAVFRGLLSRQPSETLPVVRFTYDLSRVKEVNDPRGFWVEVEKITQIAEASKARREANKSAVAEKDAALYDSRMAELLQSHHASQAAGFRIPRIITRGVTRAKSLLCRILCMAPGSHAI
ncbi:hypothetical protein MIND_01357200 [Mycena indigotica]|uniref:Uncharacterized protein n=1 Tax=Mycena indigotica TaxID=2126181 RepID=A0A8H6VQC4_9AGAR|nr:uncharacterized protein MIND_01357200 [Mycena indigotica]KAF7289829.1 hypothetical protein MIND_01357200 [Mycena indigotica]